MGTAVIVLGYSGTGKSYSLRNFAADEVGVFNILGKPMPFRDQMPSIRGKDYQRIYGGLKRNAKRAYVIDDAGYLMQLENFAMADVPGYQKFTKMAVNFERLIEIATLETDDETIVYFMMHPDYDDGGRMKPKTIGKMLDNQLGIEGMCPIVLVTDVDDSGYWFITNGPGIEKTPPGMFEDRRIPNDLKAVDTVAREFWGMAPLTAEKGAE